MATLLVNDKGANESDPYPGGFGILAIASDVASWGRVHKSFRDSVLGVIQSQEGLPNAAEAGVWAEQSEKYSNLAMPGLGFEMIVDFGPFDALDSNSLVHETIASAKEGQRLLGLLRRQADIEGGDDTGGAENVKAPGGDASMFAGGAVVATIVGAGLAAWYFTKK